MAIIFLMLLCSFVLGFYTQDYSYQKNVYFFNTSEINFQKINLIDDYKNSSILSEKIAPGTNGYFYLIISDLKADEQYKFICNENNEKPKRIIFCF